MKHKLTATERFVLECIRALGGQCTMDELHAEVNKRLATQHYSVKPKREPS